MQRYRISINSSDKKCLDLFFFFCRIATLRNMYKSHLESFMERAYMKLIKKMLRPKKASQADNYNTSLADTISNEYPLFCARAATNDSVFATFRTNPVYMQILEHVDDIMGQKYLDYILKTRRFEPKDFEGFRQNDWYGGASIRYYKEIGYMSPSTLRYIKVLGDLIESFGDLSNKDICEIGIGYGGQARIIMSMFDVKSYTFVDLDSVLSLSKKYLSHFSGLENKLHFKRMEDLEKRDYDLFISNYAFSELRSNIQDIYIEKIIKNAKHGYITFNNIAPKDFNYPLEQYESLFGKQIHIANETPNSHPLNKILTW